MRKSSFQESQEQNENEETLQQADLLSSRKQEEKNLKDKLEDLLSEEGDAKEEEDPAESDSEEEMLKRAIAMSLEDP